MAACAIAAIGNLYSYTQVAGGVVAAMRHGGRKVLVVDDDDGITAVVCDILSDEGYAVAILRDGQTQAVREAVDRLEPHCILLDGVGGDGYGASWDTAAAMAARNPVIPVIMFTAHAGAAAEAAEKASERSRAASFAALLSKPFEVDELIRVVRLAVRGPHSAARSASRERTRPNDRGSDPMVSDSTDT